MIIRVRNDQAEALRHIDAPCPSCGYNLRGLVQLSGTVCPECAHTWNVGELLPLHDVARRRNVWLMVLLALAPSLLEVAFFALGQAFEWSGLFHTAGITAMALVALFGIFWIVLVSWSWADEGAAPLFRDPGVMAVAILIGVFAANVAVIVAGFAAVTALLAV